MNPHTKLDCYVYILKSRKDGKLYTGSTRDLEARLQRHNSGEVRSTKGRAPFELVYYEACRAERDARKRESMLKLRARALTQLKRRIHDSLQ